jgi:hypothetical protein
VVWSSKHLWWQRFAVGAAEYLSWEADAYRVREWATLRMPDILWTPEYTRALLHADRVFCAEHFVGGRWDAAGTRRIGDEIESRQVRHKRLIGQTDRPMTYTVVIEEAVLRRVVGGPSVMREQLTVLLDAAGYRLVTLRAVPEKNCAQAGTDGGFAILEFPDPSTHAPTLFAHYPGGVVKEDEPRVVAQAQRRFDAVLATALPAEDSAEFVGQLMDELYPR